MKITVICAAGRQGRKLVTEALNRGHKVTAVVRKGNESPVGADVIEKDLFDLTLNDLKDSDVVIDAFGAWTEDTLPQHSTSLKYLCDILSGTDIRLLIVGGAGSLYVIQNIPLVYLMAPISRKFLSLLLLLWQRH